VVISNSRLRLNETSLDDALQTRMQPKQLGLERLHRYPAMGAKLAAMAGEVRRDKRVERDPAFLVKAFMTCLPVTGFDESNTRKPKWVECKNQRLGVSY
jgi:hypothetical protein